MRLYHLPLVLGLVCLAIALLVAPSQPSSAMPLLALTPTVPVPPTAEPTDPPVVVPPTEADPPTPEPTEPPEEVIPPTATPKPKKRDDPKPTPTTAPTPSPQPTATPEPYFVDVSLHKSVNVDVARPGDEVEYTLTGYNTGPSTAYDVVIRDSVPSEVEVIGISSSKGDVVLDGNTVIAYVSTLAPGETATVKVKARVRASVVGEVTNHAEITTTTPDGNPGNNTSTSIFRVPAPAAPPTRTIARLPVTGGFQEEGGLFSLPIWLPWVVIGLLLILFGITLRVRSKEAEATVAQFRAPAVSASEVQPIPPAATPRLDPATFELRYPLPACSAPKALPPIADNDRESALKWVQR
jgi:uncharacterized repeat protein (TIGR01451 family)